MRFCLKTCLTENWVFNEGREESKDIGAAKLYTTKLTLIMTDARRIEKME